MNECVFDSETDGLLDTLTKLHVFSWKWNDEPIQSTADYSTIREVLSQPDALYICHNAIMFDLPAFRKLGILSSDPSSEYYVDYSVVADTLALSWVLFPNRQRHGLEYLGELHGVQKPKVTDWENLSYEDYAHRCSEDVMINYLEWCMVKRKLSALYGD